MCIPVIATVPLCITIVLYKFFVRTSAFPGPEVIKKFSCSTQLSMKFILLIKLTILTFFFKTVFMLNSAEHFQLSWAWKIFKCWYFYFQDQLSWVEHEKCFITSGQVTFLNLRTTKPTLKIVRPAKTHISLRIRPSDQSIRWSCVSFTAAGLSKEG